jgi:hypothetical protein
MTNDAKNNDAPILKQLSRKVTADEINMISGGSIANTHYVSVHVDVEDNGDGTASSNGIGTAHPSYETYG